MNIGSRVARTFLTGATLVLPERVAEGLTLVIEGNRIVDLISGPRVLGDHEERVDLGGGIALPGFIDVHVHGALGIDTLDGAGALAKIAAALPQFGVTAFCPTTVACSPDALDTFLVEVGSMRGKLPVASARVLPAHLESNFLSAEYAGAQPIALLRTHAASSRDAGVFSGRDILAVIERNRADVGIVTIAPEIDGGLDLLSRLVRLGIRVSLGHSGASFDEAQAAIAAGARHATHLFNRMRAMSHRDPGLTGAVLASDDIAAELICDGRHVHPAVLRVAIAAKGSARTMAITDGTAGSGLPCGARAHLGGRAITVGDVARLDDGTLAGSVLTMDKAFTCLVGPCGIDYIDAARMCATTPARELGLIGHGVISPGAIADLTILDSQLHPAQTWVGGLCVWSEGTLPAPLAS